MLYVDMHLIVRCKSKWIMAVVHEHMYVYVRMNISVFFFHIDIFLEKLVSDYCDT